MDPQAIADLLSEDRLKLKNLYYEFRSGFFGFGKKHYKLDDTDLNDIYQEAFLALRKNAIAGKLQGVKSSMKTYLFGIGKHMMINLLKSRNKTVPYEANLHIVGEKVEEISYKSPEPLTEEQKRLREHFAKLGKKCQEMLTMFYYRGLTLEEIAAIGNYSYEVVKAQKSRCLRSLREMLKI